MPLKYWDHKCPNCGSEKYEKEFHSWQESTIFNCHDCKCLFEVGEWGIMDMCSVWLLKVKDGT